MARKTLQETQNLPIYIPVNCSTLQEQVMNDNENIQPEVISLHVNRVLPLLLHGQIAVSGVDFMGVYQNENHLLLKRKCELETVAPTKRFKCSNCREIITCAGCGAFAKQNKRGRPKGSKNKMTKVERLHCNFEAAVKEKKLMQHLNDIVPKGKMPRFRCISRPNISATVSESSPYPNSSWSRDSQNKKINLISQYSLFPTNNNNNNTEIANKESHDSNNNNNIFLEDFPEVFDLNEGSKCDTFDFDALDSLLESLPLQNDNNDRPITTPNTIDTPTSSDNCSIDKTLDFTSVTSDEVDTKIENLPWYKSTEECKLIRNYGKVSNERFESLMDNQISLISGMLKSVGEVFEKRNISMSAILKCHENKPT